MLRWLLQAVAGVGAVGLGAPLRAAQGPGVGRLGQVRALTWVYVEAMNLASLRALAYATSLAQPVLAVHIAPDQDEGGRFQSCWHLWGDQFPLKVLVSPYGALVAKRRWHWLLHSHVATRLGRALRPLPDRHHQRPVPLADLARGPAAAATHLD